MAETGRSVNAPAREKESISKAKISQKLDFFNQIARSLKNERSSSRTSTLRSVHFDNRPFSSFLSVHSRPDSISEYRI